MRRFGAAFDLLGDGSTAVKFSAGRYVANEGTGVTQGYNPIYSLRPVRLADMDGPERGPDRCSTPTGPRSSTRSGPRTTRTTGCRPSRPQYDPNLPRASNWEFSGGIERQLGAGWALSGMWHRRHYTNFDWDGQPEHLGGRLAHGRSTWTGPDDPDLPPSARGVQVPIYVTDPGYDILTGNDLHTVATGDYRTWNGFEVILDGELPRGGFMTASVTAGTNKNHFCNRGNVENPNSLRFCETRMPYRPMAKLSGALPLPFDTMISTSPGSVTPDRAGHGVSGERPSSSTWPPTTGGSPPDDLGWPESGLPRQPRELRHAMTSTSGRTGHRRGRHLIEPGTVFEDYTTEMQLRFSKVVTAGMTTTSGRGSTWTRPTSPTGAGIYYIGE